MCCLVLVRGLSSHSHVAGSREQVEPRVRQSLKTHTAEECQVHRLTPVGKCRTRPSTSLRGLSTATDDNEPRQQGRPTSELRANYLGLKTVIPWRRDPRWGPDARHWHLEDISTHARAATSSHDDGCCSSSASWGTADVVIPGGEHRQRR